MKIRKYLYVLLFCFCFDTKSQPSFQNIKYISSEQVNSSLIGINTSSSDYVIFNFIISAGIVDQFEKDGVAHIFKELFKKEIIKKIEKNNISAMVDAVLKYDSVCFSMVLKKDDLKLMIQVLSSLSFNFDIREEDFLNSKQQLIEESNENFKNDKNVLEKEVKKTLYWHAGYGLDLYPDVKSLSSISIQDLRKFKEKKCLSSNMKFVIAGYKLNFLEISNLINNKFSISKSSDNKELLNRLQEPDHHGATVKLEKNNDQYVVPIICLYWNMPNYRTDEIEAVNGEISVLALTKKIQDNFNELKIPMTVSFELSQRNYMCGNFKLSIIPMMKIDADYLQKIVLSEIKNIAQIGFNDKEIDDAIKHLQSMNKWKSENVMDIVFAISDHFGSENSLESIENYNKSFNKVKNKNINDWIKKNFKNDPSVISILKKK